MSISLTLINKSDNKYKVGKVVSTLIDTVNDNYISAEKENYISKDGKSCLSIFFQGEDFKPHQGSECLIKKISNENYNFTLVKQVVKLEQLGNSLAIWNKINSPIIVLEITRMINGLEFRPPWILSGEQLVFPVGEITQYFRTTSDSPYKNDIRGFKFAEKYKSKNQTEIATAYYDNFVEKGKALELANAKKTGLIHFTTVVTLKKNKLQFSFIQNRLKIAHYFFDPDILFSSNELIARSIRKALYSKQDIPMKNNLRYCEIFA